MTETGKNKLARENRIPYQCHAVHNKSSINWDRIQAAVVSVQKHTTWTMARSYIFKDVTLVTSVSRVHFMYHVVFGFLRSKWLWSPEDGAVTPKHVGVTNIIMVYVTLTCILLDAKFTVGTEVVLRMCNSLTVFRTTLQETPLVSGMGPANLRESHYFLLKNVTSL